MKILRYHWVKRGILEFADHLVHSRDSKSVSVHMGIGTRTGSSVNPAAVAGIDWKNTRKEQVYRRIQW